MNAPDRGPITAQRLEANWRAITAELDAPLPSRLERALRRAGVPTTATRLALATPALRRAWFLALAVTLVVGLGAVDPSDPRSSLFTLLVLVPLVPVLGVAFAYGPSADPSHEIQLATPMRGLRLLAIRTATVLVASAVVIVPLALLSDVARPMAVAWVLPALAMTTASLGLMTVTTPRRATTIVAVGWLAVAMVVRAAADDDVATFGVVGQLTCLAVAIAGVTVATCRRAAFDRLDVNE